MSLKVKTKSVKKPKIQKFLRLPVDEKTDRLIQDIIAENPFFTPLDAIRFILGKFIKQGNQRKSLVYFSKLKELHSDTPKLSEDQIFQILEKNNLM